MARPKFRSAKPVFAEPTADTFLELPIYSKIFGALAKKYFLQTV
jgi:hypothetical protein